MFSEAPPSRDDARISRTCFELVDVKILTSSGITAPAIVPQLMIADSFHHSDPSPRSGIIKYETMNVRMTETSDVSHTSDVSGCSKSILSAFSYLPFATASLTQYEPMLATTIMMRIAKIQTSSCTCVAGSATARRMKLMSATPVTPYVSNPSAVGPTE